MRNIIVLAALETEFFTSEKLIQKIHYTGIGKINSSRITTQLILSEKPDLILNVGTAGALKREMLGCVLVVRDVVERIIPLFCRITIGASANSGLSGGLTACR